jgi:hypothetical protein
MIAGGMLSQLQVVYMVVNKPFKDRPRHLCSEWLLRANNALTPSLKMKKTSVSVLGEWILTARERTSSELRSAAFRWH